MPLWQRKSWLDRMVLVVIDTGKDSSTGMNSLAKEEKEASRPSPASPRNLLNAMDLAVAKVVKEREVEVVTYPLSCQLALLVQLQLWSHNLLLVRLCLLLS